jgi:nucleoside-diphosphate kinase
MEQTLVLTKPDGVQRGLIGEVVKRLERRGLKIVAMKMMKMDGEMAGRHYQMHKDKAFYNDLVSFITSAPVVAMVLQGERAIELTRQVMGSTDPLKAAPGTIRGDLGFSMQNNLVHGSDSPQAAEREIALFFEKEEILDYSRSNDGWIGY